MGFKVDGIYQDILEKIMPTGKEVNTIGRHKNEIKAALAKLTKDVKESSNKANKPTIGLNMIDWVPDKELTFYSLDYDDSDAGEVRGRKKARRIIDGETYEIFERMVRRIPLDVDIDHAWDTYPLEDFSHSTKESKTKIKRMFGRIRRTTKPAKQDVLPWFDPEMSTTPTLTARISTGSSERSAAKAPGRGGIGC